MKKICLWGLLGIVMLAALACTSVSTVPLMLITDTRPEFEILGEIIYESSERTGYIELLRSARRLYPDCDYVIDIMVDQKTTTTMFMFMRAKVTVTWVMRGTAVRYKR